MSRTVRMIRRVTLFVSASTLAVLTLTSCATIIHGSRQDVGISSSPMGASVWIDNSEKGRTPLITKLRRKDNHIVRIQLDGYQPFEATLTRGVSGWVWGNVVFGGLIGLAVDAISGGIYKLAPDQISGALGTKAAAVTKTGDGVYVFAVMKPQSDWVKVAQLQH